MAEVAQSAPQLRYTFLQDASHAMLVEQPERLAALIGNFLTAR